MKKRFLSLALSLLLAFAAATTVFAAHHEKVLPLKLDDCGLAAHWAAPFACDLIHQGVLEAKGLNLDAPVTEGQFNALLGKAMGKFLALGVTKPETVLTRQEAMRMLGIALGWGGLENVDVRVLDQYKDTAGLDDTAKRTIAFMLLHGVVQGRAEGHMAPEATLTLGEAIKLIQTAVPEKLAAGVDKLSLVLFNDLHGHLIQDSRKRASQDVGIERLTTAIMGQMLKNPNTLLLDGGDSYQGTPISNLVSGKSTLAWKNFMGVKAAVIGNHEFDWGVETLQKLMDSANHPTLTANVFKEGTDERPSWAKPSAMVELAGYKVGIVGITTPITKNIVVAENVAGLEFRNPTKIIDLEVRSLRAAGADLVFVVFHASASPGKTDAFKVENEVADFMAGVTERVDAVTGAHSHEKTAGYVLDAKGNMIPAIQAGSYSRALGRIDLYVDKATKEVTRAVPVVWEPSQTLAATPWATSVLADWAAQVKPIESQPVGKLAKPLSRSVTESGESVLGDFIADGMLTALAGIDIAVMNGGGIRADLEGENGNVTWGHLYTVQPFGNTLVTVEMTGAEVKTLLEQGIESYRKRVLNQGGASPMQVAGISYTYDWVRPLGERIDSATLKLADGSLLDPATTYKVVVNSFMAGGGDGLAILASLKAKQIDLGVIDLDVTVAYFKAKAGEGALDYSLQNRIQVLNFKK